MLQLAQPQDRDSVNQLAGQLVEMRRQWRPERFEQSQELYTPERFAEVIRKRQLYVAKVDSFVVGYVLLTIDHEDSPGRIQRRVMSIQEICVQKKLRNQGIGRQIMTDIQALSYAFGCQNLSLKIMPHNDEAVGFFQKCGFTIQMITMEK